MCLLPKIGSGCSIEGEEVVTQANFCPWMAQPPAINGTTPSNSSKSVGNATAQTQGRVEGEWAGGKAACSRMRDFHALVERAEFEVNKEKIEGHIRSNSLVFNTFIFLQVGTG